MSQPFLPILFVALSLSAFNFAYAKETPTVAALKPEPREDDWWVMRHQVKGATKATMENLDILLVGDSITHGWENPAQQAIWNEHLPNLKVHNIGFSGDRTEHVLWRLGDGAVEGISPKVTIVMIGTNNTGHRQDPASDTAAGIEAIVKDLRQRLPETKILLLSVFPRGATSEDPLRKINVGINEIIPKLAGDGHVTYLDLTDKFIDADGNIPTDIMPDMLHPNPEGYKIWAAAMKPAVQNLLAE